MAGGVQMLVQKSGSQSIDQAIGPPGERAVDEADMAAVELDSQADAWADPIGTGGGVWIHEGIVSAVEDQGRGGDRFEVME